MVFNDAMCNPSIGLWLRNKSREVTLFLVLVLHSCRPMSKIQFMKFRLRPGPNFIELLSTKICSALNFFLDKNRITNQISVFCILLGTGIQLSFDYPENHVEIWLVILFLSRKKFHSGQIFVLSSFMKFGPGGLYPPSPRPLPT